MFEFAVLYNPEHNNWLRFQHPLERVEVHDPAQVIPALQRIEHLVEQEGHFAAGFVSYEAAPAFDDALQTCAADDFPLLSFGIFAVAERIDLLPPAATTPLSSWRTGLTEPAFTRKVEAIRHAIARGETYQVNLTFPLQRDFVDDPWAFFCHLVHGQQSQGAGFMESGRWTICSASPELFFRRDGDRLIMRPMKGTAPRGRSCEEDRRQAEELSRSAKNRAENIMILDMVRNDLGRLAPPGEVHAAAICALEKYPTVWQMTSTAIARSEASYADIFRALFPCASITGAPKVKTMQIIAALEEAPRRIYTGTFGWMAPGRQAHFNVAIRTALIDRKAKTATYGVGAGITWDSISGEEYRECLLKGEILMRPRDEFALLETLRWTPGRGYFLLPEHMARLQASAEYFNFDCAVDRVEDFLRRLAKNFPAAAQRVRLLLHRDGQMQETCTDLVNGPSAALKLRLAPQPIDSKNLLLYHKTTQRRIYDEFLEQTKEADEVVLWNERGEITECCTANLVVELAGKLVTPPVDSGLLPGTYRDFLLRRGILTEQVLTLDDLRNSTRIYLINAVRKWRRAILF